MNRIVLTFTLLVVITNNHIHTMKAQTDTTTELKNTYCPEYAGSLPTGFLLLLDQLKNEKSYDQYEISAPKHIMICSDEDEKKHQEFAQSIANQCNSTLTALNCIDVLYRDISRQQPKRNGARIFFGIVQTKIDSLLLSAVKSKQNTVVLWFNNFTALLNACEIHDVNVEILQKCCIAPKISEYKNLIDTIIAVYTLDELNEEFRNNLSDLYDELIHIPLPNEKTRTTLFKYFLERAHVNPPEQFPTHILSASEEIRTCDIEKIAKKAIQIALIKSKKRKRIDAGTLLCYETDIKEAAQIYLHHGKRRKVKNSSDIPTHMHL